MKNNKTEALARTNKANYNLSLLLVIFGLIVLVFGNNDAIKNWQFAGGDADDLASNIGLAIIIAAVTQFYTDFRVREKFYSDISDHIAANESLRLSGIVKYFPDSKECSPKSVLYDATRLDVGVTYSDRFLKDYMEIIISRKEKIEVRVFRTDLSDKDTLAALAHNNGMTHLEIENEGKNLDKIIDELKKKGTSIEVFTQKFIPHFSFYVIDGVYFFYTMSTFSSRKAMVPLFQSDQSSQISILIQQDMQTIIEAQANAE